jgi:hypothetical protein
MFLDREPYIHYWRPIYGVIGPFTRPIRLWFRHGGRVRSTSRELDSIQARLGELEAADRNLWKALEETLLAALAAQQTTPDVLRSVLEEALAIQTAQIAAANAAHWAAIEKLLIAAMGPNSATSAIFDQQSVQSGRAGGEDSRLT